MGGKGHLIVLKKYLLAALLVSLVCTQSGCALLKIPFTLTGGALSLVGKVLQVVDKLPKPPPGVF